jgi:hypothetical protein
MDKPEGEPMFGDVLEMLCSIFPKIMEIMAITCRTLV